MMAEPQNLAPAQAAHPTVQTTIRIKKKIGKLAVTSTI